MITTYERRIVSSLFVLIASTLLFGAPRSVAPGVTHAQSQLKHGETIYKLITCESEGKSVKVVDVNGYYSYGILQYQSSTWNLWSSESGIQGDPMNEHDAIRMADWAIEKGYLRHWSCAHKLRLLSA